MDTRELQTADAPHVVEALTAAFQPDPGFVFMAPDPEARVDAARAVFTVMARYGFTHGLVLGTPGGAAICLPPGHEVTPDGMGAAGIGDVAPVLGDDGMERMGRLVGTLGELHARVMPEPHWQLFFLGVEPSRQGSGEGVALVDALSARARADGVPCYLDTLTQRNVDFYRRRGYDVIGETDVPGSDVHAWALRT
jgi:ribosomal protein S18 acetylase RimI-like enzyme